MPSFRILRHEKAEEDKEGKQGVDCDGAIEEVKPFLPAGLEIADDDVREGKGDGYRPDAYRVRQFFEKQF